MWVIDDKSESLLANTGGLEYMGEPLIDGGKKLPLVECFERKKNSHFLFAYSYCRFSFYQYFANQLLEGTVGLM